METAALFTVDEHIATTWRQMRKFSLLLTDAARYMSLVGRALKELYPSLMYFSCIAHVPHNCTMRVRAYFKNINDVEATITAATIKSKDRRKDVHETCLLLSFDPVITRWATWLKAELCYSEYFFCCSFCCQQLAWWDTFCSRAKESILVN